MTESSVETRFLRLVEQGFHQYSNYRVIAKKITLPGGLKFHRTYLMTIVWSKKKKGWFWWLKTRLRGDYVKHIEFDIAPGRMQSIIDQGIGSPLLQDFVKTMIKKIERHESLFNIWD